MNDIPPMTDPMGAYWKQPDAQQFAIDDNVALMYQRDFEALHDYSASTPSGVYPGKCWKSQFGGVWYLRWYGADDGDPRGLPTYTRQIIVC